jgi:hypothetical protein
MSSGLAGIGREDDWTVTLDETIGSPLYGVTIENGQISIQIAGVPIEQTDSLCRFLQASRNDEVFEFQSCFGGKLAFVDNDGSLLVRILEKVDEANSNLVELTVGVEQRAKLALALSSAINDAKG